MRARYGIEEFVPGGSRGIRKTPSKLVPAVMPVQILMVVRNPRRPRSACIRKGQTEPVMFLEDRTAAYAKARLFDEKYSLRTRFVGLYIRTHPKAAMTPCVAIRCHTLVLKEDAKKPAQASSTPQKVVALRYVAQRRVNAAARKGIERYMTPLEVVPTIPTELRLP